MDVDLVIGRIGLVTTEVDIHAGCPKDGAGDTELDGQRRIDDADPCGAGEEDLVPSDKVLILIAASIDLGEDARGVLRPPSR